MTTIKFEISCKDVDKVECVLKLWFTESIVLLLRTVLKGYTYT